MSITSWTSPRASLMILPFSRLMRRARSCLRSRNALPSRRTISPRLGAGTIRQRRNASSADLDTAPHSAAVAVATDASTLPVEGSWVASFGPVGCSTNEPPCATPDTEPPSSIPNARKISSLLSTGDVFTFTSTSLALAIGYSGTYGDLRPVSYTHLRAHETRHDLVCRLLLEKKKM